jgi:hypothetical protein
MTGTQPWYFSFWGLGIAFLGGAVGIGLFAHQRWRRRTIADRLSARLWYEFVVGAFLATAIAFYEVNRGLVPLTDEVFLEGLVHSLVVFVLLELIHTGQSLEVAESILRAVDDDERIIFARQNLSTNSAALSVVGIEPVPIVPELLARPTCGGEWAQSISFLKLDRVQDLLFCEKYLDHFFALRAAANTKSRILIIRDPPRANHDQAVHAFLRISIGTGFATYVQRETEFNSMITAIPELVGRNKHEVALAVSQILLGNTELNVMVEGDNEPTEWNSGPVNKDQDYLLRYTGDGGVKERRPGDRRTANNHGPLDHSELKWTLRLMATGLQDKRRVETADDIPAKLANASLWSRNELVSLKKTKRWD